MKKPHLSKIARALYTDSFDEWRVDDQPYVDCSDFDSLEEALDEFGRRVYKSGRLEEYEQRQHFTKPSERRRKERQAAAHRAKTGAEWYWQGGVQS